MNILARDPHKEEKNILEYKDTGNNPPSADMTNTLGGSFNDNSGQALCMGVRAGVEDKGTCIKLTCWFN